MDKKGKVIFVIVSILIFFLVFIVTSFLLTGRYKNIINHNINKKTQEEKIVSYNLEEPKLPLEDIYNFQYITSKEEKINNSFCNCSYSLYVDNNNDLIIKNDKDKTKQKAKTVSNVKYIIYGVPIEVLTNDGKIYRHTSETNIETYDSLNFEDIDSFKKIEFENKETTIENIIEIKNGIDEAHELIAETSNKTYYDTSEMTLEELVKNKKLEIISIEFFRYKNHKQFNLYVDGKMTFSGKYSDGVNEKSFEKKIYDENDNQLYGYKYLVDENDTLYIVSLDNKLYSIENNEISYDTKIIAEKLNDKKITKIDYNNNKNKVIFYFSDNTNYEVNKVYKNRTYDIFIGREDE